MSACSNLVDKPNVLFDIGDTRTTSHNFEVRPGEVWIVSAQGLMDDDVIVIETVTGCGVGDMFECYVSPSCGCVVELSCSNGRVVIPYTGRYRAVIQTGVPGDYRVTAYPTSGVGFTEGQMACGCSGTKNGAVAADAILGSPSALAGLCQGMAPCIVDAVADATDTPVGSPPHPIVSNIINVIRTDPTLHVEVTDVFGVVVGHMIAA